MDGSLKGKQAVDVKDGKGYKYVLILVAINEKYIKKTKNSLLDQSIILKAEFQVSNWFKSVYSALQNLLKFNV